MLKFQITVGCLLMADVNNSAKIVRFGVFEADLQTGELRKNGVKVPLQGQPFQVCAILLEQLGKVGHSRGTAPQESGRKIPLSILTTRSIQRLPRSDSHWETKPTTPGLWRLCLAAAIVSLAPWTSQCH